MFDHELFVQFWSVLAKPRYTPVSDVYPGCVQYISNVPETGVYIAHEKTQSRLRTGAFSGAFVRHRMVGARIGSSGGSDAGYYQTVDHRCLEDARRG